MKPGILFFTGDTSREKIPRLVKAGVDRMIIFWKYYISQIK